MAKFSHSVSLNTEKCRGCTHCLTRCPTEAIRTRGGHAEIDPARCIDCGECIRICPYKAQKATSDPLSALDGYRYKIALPPPSLYGQFDHLDDIDYLLQGLLDFGFDEVFEVARAAEIVSGYTRRYLNRTDIPKPVISSACPVITRLIELRFPYLIENVMPLLAPVDVAAQLARKEALEKHPELSPSDIGICFISPCPAKVSYLKNEKAQGRGNVDCVVSVSDIYFQLVSRMERKLGPAPVSKTGMIGVSWAATGGEASALFNDRYLAADGIENAMHVLDNLDNGSFPELEFIELNACSGGCVGGVLTVENPFIAKARLQTLRRYLPVTQNWNFQQDIGNETSVPEEYFACDGLHYAPTTMLDGDKNEAIRKRTRIQEIMDTLPALDCGSCGSPTCRAFAEDVVRGRASLDECMVLLRKKLQKQAEDNHDGCAADPKSPGESAGPAGAGQGD